MSFNRKSFRKTLLYQATPSLMQLQATMRDIEDHDRHAEKKQRLYDILLLFFFPPTILLFIFCFINPSLIGPFLILLLMTIAVGTSERRWSRLDVPDLRYELPPILGGILIRDMAQDALFDVQIDFSKPTVAQKKVAEAPWSRRPSWTETVFEDAWLRMSGCFIDGTIFTLTLNEHTIVREGTTTGRSGKSKRKTKIKPKGFDAQILLEFSRKKYGAITVLKNDLRQAVSLPEGTNLKKLKVKDHQLLIQVKVLPTCDKRYFYQLFTKMLLSAYQGLNLSKALSKVS